ncbi:SDR family NAD(P)-dependent oxidoreductase [Actinosynnema sp. NPDC050801]|uniref:SDR family NAD(P)-dependent oxidoreductase n=1 Tax=unclassified Actinosynnema TaxID=2637065 RepID=UPI0033D45CE1
MVRASIVVGEPVRPVPAVPHRWHVVGSTAHPLASRLRRDGGEAGTAVLLGSRFRPADNALLLEGVASALRHGGPLVLAHLGAGGGSLLRVAALEDPRLAVRVVELPAVPSREVADLAVAAVDSVDPDLLVDERGRIARPAGQAVELPPRRPLAGTGVLVTGGARGLGLRAALVLAYVHGWCPVVVDAAWPDARAEERLASVGAVVVRADVTDRGELSRALADVGVPIGAVVHCAGTLAAGAVRRCTPADLARAQAAKVTGLRTVLDVLPADRLRHLVVFGSITARDPHRQMGAYGLANELLRRAALREAARLPGCSTVVAEWSLWSGAGMAHEVGAVAQARRMGMTPISLRAGMDALLRLLHWPSGRDHAAAIRLD